VPAPGPVPAGGLSRFSDLLRQLDDRAHRLHDRSRRARATILMSRI
jgi:hypothetical protein